MFSLTKFHSTAINACVDLYLMLTKTDIFGWTKTKKTNQLSLASCQSG